LSGNRTGAQARGQQIARHGMHSCAPDERFECQNAAGDASSGLFAWRLSAFGTVAGLPKPAVMHKIHILTDY
jgi:hypothetical protein